MVDLLNLKCCKNNRIFPLGTSSLNNETGTLTKKYYHVSCTHLFCGLKHFNTKYKINILETKKCIHVYECLYIVRILVTELLAQVNQLIAINQCIGLTNLEHL